MYGDVVLGLKRESDLADDPFESILDLKKEALGVTDDTELPAEALREIVVAYKERIREKLGVDFPDDPWEQLWAAIGAVFESIPDIPLNASFGVRVDRVR